MGNKINKTNEDALKTYEELLMMGFDDTISFEAANKFPKHRDKAIHYILQQHGSTQKVNKKIFRDMNHTNCKSITDCLCIERMKTLLTLYNDNMNKTSFMDIVHKQIAYNIEHIINDYVHIIQHHNHNLEDVYNLLNIPCKLDKCNGLRRNQRNRMENNKEKKSKNENNVEETVMMDIIDQIHAYLLHTFDIGYRLTKDEQNNINASMQEEKTNGTSISHSFPIINDLLKSKWKKFEQMVGIDGRINHSKFVTTTHENEEKLYIPEMEKMDNDTTLDATIYIEDQKQDDDELEGDSTNVVYSFSQRYNYWTDSIDYYVDQKYDSLRTEILQNPICKLRVNEFIEAEKKANIFYKSVYAKQLKCAGVGCHNKSEYYYNGAPISIHHLLAIILYTDYDLLSYKFSTTYRPKHSSESIQEIILRHTNYYWFGRLLRELVEGFGKELQDEDGAYYHGVSGNVTFTSTIAKFHHPMSTTKQVIVAQRFATNNGVIISVKTYQFNVSYFNCDWISAFGNEEESLFIGGLFPLQITNIIHCNTGEQYGKYVKAINIFSKVLDGNYDIYNISESDEILISSIINNDNTEIPLYVMNLFKAYRYQKKIITMNFCDISQYSPYLSSILLTNPKEIAQSFVHLNIFESLFPRCHTIKFHDINISTEYIALIATSLSQYQWGHLRQIEIRNVTATVQSISLLSEKNRLKEKYDDYVTTGKNYNKLKKQEMKRRKKEKKKMKKERLERLKKRDDMFIDDMFNDEMEDDLVIDLDDKRPNINAEEAKVAVKDDMEWIELNRIIDGCLGHFKATTPFNICLNQDGRFNVLLIKRKK